MYYSLNNLSGTATTELEKPWEYTASKIPESVTNKREYGSWTLDNGTVHAFISAVEGSSPGLRVSKENPAYKVHGFIVDYDASVTPAMLQGVLAKPPSEFKPRYAYTTFSGGARLIFTFERPLLISSTEQYKRLAAYAAKTLKLTKWLPGFDAPAFGKVSQHYEIGKDYMDMFDQDIPAANLNLWLYEVSKDIKLSTDVEYTIPMDRVAEEVERRWPGRWKGNFEEGARGVRFWDSTADDPSGCAILKHGVMAFSGEQAFIPWGKLLGSSFVEAFEADKLGGLLENTAYDGREFWFFDGRRWESQSKDDYTQMLRVEGFDSSKGKSTASEIDRVQIQMKLDRRVERAMPFIYYPTGIIRYDGTPYLNISTVKVMEAAPPNDKITEWKDGKTHFPFIYRWWNEMFGKYSIDPEPSQLVHVLGEMWYAYTNILLGTPKPRHVQIIAGDPNCGKTLYAQKALGAIYGGFSDANSFFVEGEQWTEHTLEKGLLCIDDPTTGFDQKKIARMTSMLKRMPANGMVMYNAKFKKSGQVPYLGGITFTLNTDDTSMGLMPDLDSSTKDKFCLFKASTPKSFDMPKWGEIDKVLAKELPNLLRFILNWTPPTELFSPDARRFGIKPYHHKDMLRASLNHGNAGIVLELLIEFARQFKDANPKHEGNHWEGTATVLYEMMSAFGLTTVKQQTVRGFATSLGVLHNRGVKVESIRDSKSLQRRWKVDLGLGAMDAETILQAGVKDAK
jgi:hypothetical protein